MEQHFAKDERLRRYLLDELPAPECERIEEWYFADNDGFERLLAAEDELIDAYVAGELIAAERDQFERAFMTTAARRDRVAFARTLRQVVDREAGSRAPAPAAAGTWRRAATAWLRSDPWRGRAPAWAVAAALVVLVAGGAFVLLDRLRLQEAMERLQTEAASLIRRNEQLQQEVRDERGRTGAVAGGGQPSAPGDAGRGGTALDSPPLIASFLLVPRLVRAGDGNLVRVPPGAALVRLQLELEADSYPRYRPVLTTAGGEDVWRQRPLPATLAAGGPQVTIDLPAKLLTTGDYILTLDGLTASGGFEEAAAYSFRLIVPSDLAAPPARE